MMGECDLWNGKYGGESPKTPKSDFYPCKTRY